MDSTQGRSAERAVIRWAAKDPVGQEVIRHRLNQLRADLAGRETPTVLERLMIDQVALTWLEINTWVEDYRRQSPVGQRRMHAVRRAHGTSSDGSQQAVPPGGQGVGDGPAAGPALPRQAQAVR